MSTIASTQPMGMAGNYPVDTQDDGPQQQSRLMILLRPLLLIPHAIVLAFIGIAVGVITLIAWFAILFTGKYPAGMMNFVVGALHWYTRVFGYQYFLTGVYPPFANGENSSYPVRLFISPQEEGRNRVTVLLRIFMIIPHVIILYFVQIAANVIQFISWIIGIFTGNVPAGMHNFMAGYMRWSIRVAAYGLLLTDEYPPFALN